MIDVSKLKDSKLKCCDCGDAFTWTAGEQAFYLSKGLATPRRCKPCRDHRPGHLHCMVAIATYYIHSGCGCDNTIDPVCEENADV